jgi:hypothetical protein
MTDLKQPDPPLRVVMAEAWQLLTTNPGLWTPPLVLNLLIAMIAGNGAKGAALIVPMIGAWMLTIAFRAGWFEQMYRVVTVDAASTADSPPRATWGQFLEGVGHYFWRFLGGEIAQLALLGLGLGIAVWYGGSTIGWPDQAMIEQVMKATRQSGDALKALPPETIAKLNDWTMILVGWAGYWGILALGLVFWQTFCVWQNRSWPTAWLQSLRAVGRHRRMVVPMAFLQIVSYLLVFQFLASGVGLIMMAGYAGYLLVWTFFTLVLFLMVKRWEPHAAPTPESP